MINKINFLCRQINIKYEDINHKDTINNSLTYCLLPEYDNHWDVIHKGVGLHIGVSLYWTTSLLSWIKMVCLQSYCTIQTVSVNTEKKQSILLL